MSLTPGSQLYTQDVQDFYNNIDTAAELLNSLVLNSYTAANNLYNHSSTMEDILVNNLAGFYNKIKSVTYSYTGSSVVFIESFESLAYVDKKFYIDQALNVDTTNKTLTLPVKSTKNQDVASIIVEPDSNGMPGNSLNGFKNADISAILDNDTSTIYEYEKFTNIFEADKLTLVLTFTLANVAVINSIYIKLYSESEIQYPIVDSIQVSLDAVNWTSLDAFISSNEGQNDHYIRFIAQRTRYVRINLSQQVAQYVSTGFGIKNRYSIGIRDINIITDEFKDSGDYVSIPFTTGKQISNVSLTADYKSNSDIQFLISANNGGTWLPITPDGTKLSLLDINTGVLISDNLRSIRTRINMKRVLSPLLNSTEETLQYNASQSYQLKYYPTDLTGAIGGYISCGDIVRYNVNANLPYNILNKLYLNSGLKIYSPGVSGGSSYTTHFNDPSIVLTPTSTSGTAIDNVRYFILNSIFGNSYNISCRYIPYYYGIDNDISVYIGDELVPQFTITDGIIYINYLFLQHPNTMHSYLYVDLYNIGAITNTNGTININGSISSGINLKYKPYTFTPEMSQVTRNIITLNMPILNSSSQNIIVTITEPLQNPTTLDQSQYSISDDRITITISDAAFSNTATYTVSYVPSVDITSLLPSADQISQSIQIPALIDAPYTSSLVFRYKYQDQQSLSDSKYYSPICKDYTLSVS